ncbi:hypothetical protein Tco_0704243 [Tanacetum coccineum]|uniref:Reverse transcriptase domain-containing protein n=1 Tax=Tanacetum coccineum TaxID=301880 RepID=A0ABQ4Y1Z7_9ASTR
MADNRTMAQMLQAPTEGYEDAIVIPEINANFELKHGLINLVQNKYLDRFNDLLRACPHHGFSELHQLDTFYNALNANDQDSLNSAAGGNFLDKMPRECLRIIENVAALTTEVSELKNLMKTMLIDKQKVQAPATVKAVEQSCVTCGGQVYQPPTIQTPVYQAPTQQMQGVSKTDFENYVKANDAVLRNMQNQGQGLQNQMTNLTEMLSKFITSNTASSSNSGTLPSQTVTNPREHVNAITTRSGKTCEGPSTPLVPTPVVSTPLKEPEQNPETSMDKVQKPSLESTAQIPPPEEEESIFMKPKAKKTVNIEIQEPNSPKPTSYQPKLPYPERMKVRENDKPSAQHSRFLKMFKQLRLEIGLKDALVEMPKFNKWLSSLLRNKEKLEEIALQRRPFLRTAKALIDLYEEKLTLRVGSDELVFYAKKSKKSKNKQFAHAISFFSRKTSDNLEEFADELTPFKKDVHFQVNSNPLFEFDDNFTSSNVNPLFNEMDVDVENKNSNVSDSDEPVLLNTPLSNKDECFAPEDDIDEIDAFLAMEVSSNFEEGYFDSEGDVTFLDNLLSDDTTHNLAPEVISDHEPEQNESSITFSPRSDPLHHEFAGELLTLPSRIVREHEDYLNRMTLLSEISISRSQENVHANPSSIIESLPISLIPVEDSEPVQEEIDIFLVPDDLIPPGVENDDSEDEDNELPNLDHQDDPSIPRPPPEPPDVEKCLEPEAGILITKVFKGVSKPHDFMADILPTLPTLVSDLTFILFLSSFLSFGSEDTIFDPGIITFPFSYLEPVAFSMEVSCSNLQGFSSEVDWSRLFILGWGLKNISTYPVDGGDAGENVHSWDSETTCTDISKITRKQSKTGKHGHGKRKSTKEAKDSKEAKKSQLSVNYGSTKVNH